MENCLNNIIGLSATECPCTDDDKPTDASLSTSGYYIDELEGLSLKGLKSAEDCHTGGLWDMLTRSRELAIMDFEEYLYRNISEAKQILFANNNYIIGKKRGVLPISSDAQKIGVRIMPMSVKDGYIHLTEVGFLFNGSFTLDFEIYSNEQDAPLHSFSGVNITANVPSYYELDVKLPMQAEDGSVIEYFIVYDNPYPIAPLKNGIGCCGTNVTYCHDVPCFHKNKDIGYKWTQYLMVAGIDGELNKWRTTSNCGSGMILKLKLCCDTSNLLCDNICDNNGLSKVVAKAIQYRAGYRLNGLIYKSGKINKYTLLESEEMLATINSSYHKEFLDRVAFVSENLDVMSSGCFVCEQRMLVKGRKI